MLSSVDWDLQRAIEIRLAGDSTEDDHSTEYGASAPVHDVGRMMQSGLVHFV